MFDKTKTTGPNAGLRVSPNSDGRVVSQERLRDGDKPFNPNEHPTAIRYGKDGTIREEEWRPNSDGGVISKQYFRHGFYTETPPNPEGLMVNPTQHPKAQGWVPRTTAPGPVSEEWYKDGKRVSAEDWYKDGAPTPRPGGVKAAAAAAAAKQAQPEVIAKTAPKKARDDDQR
jgi:hypothetical protein